MKLRVTMENEGGELAVIIVDNVAAAKEAIFDLLMDCEYLQSGDVFRIQQVGSE